MSRWEPDEAGGAFVTGALQPFSEYTYDKTNVGEIADRAGHNRSASFSATFPTSAMSWQPGRTFCQAVRRRNSHGAGRSCTLDAVGRALATAAAAMTPLNRELAPPHAAVIASRAELHERDQFKHVGVAAAMPDALRAPR
jgi:hypothetical protein